MSEKQLSRRDVLNTLLYGVPTIMAVAGGLDTALNRLLPAPESSKTTSQIIEEIKNKYGIDVSQPEKLTNGETNTPWNTSELLIIQEALGEVPPITLTNPHFPKQLHLYKSASQVGVNGFLNGTGYANSNIDIILTTAFNGTLENTGTEKVVFGTQKKLLKSILLHETTHSLTESNIELLKTWESSNGWVQNPDGAWANYYPEQIIPLANSNLYPWEDMAVSLSVFAENPSYLLKLSKSRYDFFINNPVFQNWNKVISYKKKACYYIK